jgi:hypothetical protein
MPWPGERVGFHAYAADSGEELMQFDLVLTPRSREPATHVHLHHSEQFSVRSGTIRVVIGDQEVLLGEAIRRWSRSERRTVVERRDDRPATSCGGIAARKAPAAWRVQCRPCRHSQQS